MLTPAPSSSPRPPKGSGRAAPGGPASPHDDLYCGFEDLAGPGGVIRFQPMCRSLLFSPGDHQKESFLFKVYGLGGLLAVIVPLTAVTPCDSGSEMKLSLGVMEIVP